MKVEIINKSTNPLPEYAKIGDSGMDIRADFSKGVDTKHFYNADYDEIRKCILIFSGGRCLVPTGLFTSLPQGYELQIRSRSGLALKSGVFCTNGIGTIDANYKNEIGVILSNISDEVFEIFQGDRIAQAVLANVPTIEWIEVETLSGEDRGGGFGHTGTK